VRTPRPLPWIVLLAAVACATVPAGRASATEPAYPRLGIYGKVHGDGAPFFHAPTDSTLDTTVLDEYARYDQLVLDIDPLSPYRPDILAQLRARHPGLRVLGYVTGDDIWFANSADSLNHFPTVYRRTVRDLGGFLYNRIDGTEFAHCNVNLALRDGNGRYVVAEAVADLFASQLATGLWDGLFLDEYCHDPTWRQDPTHQFDWARAGYSSYAEFLAAWEAGTDTLASRLRRDAGPGVRLVGNCGDSAEHGAFNGWMRENFPFQRGGTWFDNMLVDPLGYLADDRDFVQPSSNYLFSALVGVDGDEYTANNTRVVRFGLGSAALGDGYGVFGPHSADIADGLYYQWWYDEYSVDLSSGQAMTDLAHTHWLGNPLAAPYQMIWVGTNPDACSNPGFETSVTSGWSFGVFSPASATLDRDTTTAGVGVASAHVNVAAPGVNGWDVNLTSAGSLTMVGGGRYAATFWAKASSPRVVPVVATLPAGGQLTSQNVTLGTTWRQYQVVLTPASSGTVLLEFFLGLQAGEVWFDDVHLQAGETSLWRRDFDNGVVLVNPGLAAMQVPLGGTYRHIVGVRDPAVNNGSSVTSATVPPSDALFLIGMPRDVTPPSNIIDAHIKP